jgi:hypothetical protein
MVKTNMKSYLTNNEGKGNTGSSYYDPVLEQTKANK